MRRIVEIAMLDCSRWLEREFAQVVGTDRGRQKDRPAVLVMRVMNRLMAWMHANVVHQELSRIPASTKRVCHVRLVTFRNWRVKYSAMCVMITVFPMLKKPDVCVMQATHKRTTGLPVLGVAYTRTKPTSVMASAQDVRMENIWIRHTPS